MSVLAPAPDTLAVGDALLRDVAELLPMRRCITGGGLRETLDWIGDRLPLARSEVPTGTAVGDWTIPPEWGVREAYVELPDGSRLVDWADSALHLVQYSVAVDATMTLGELRPRLHTLPERPTATPYRTSYYVPRWGFCLPNNDLQRALDAFGDAAPVRVVIDAEHTDGALSLAECVIPGESDDEILLSAHVCHPHLANDNAAATAVLTEAGRRLIDAPRRHHTVRLLFAPGTLGALTWLARSPGVLPRVRGGLVLATLGDAGPLVYKRTRRGTLGRSRRAEETATDRAAALALRDLGVPHETRPFAPVGYDERQFCAAGLDLNMGRLSRTPWGEYPEYHTSDDDLSLLDADALAGSLDAVLAVVDALDASAPYRTTVAVGEPMLGRHGLYTHAKPAPAEAGGTATKPDQHRALLWALNVADGEHSLLDAAQASGLPVAALAAAAERARAAGVLTRSERGDR